MTLIDNPDQQALAESVRKLVAARSPLTKVREVALSDQSYDADVWRLVCELGVPGLAIPEQYGGAGGTWADLFIVLRELGAGLVQTPLFASSVLAGGALLASDDEELKSTWLPRLADGSTIGALAVSEENDATWGSQPSTVTAADGKVSGTKVAVLNGAEADLLIVQASDGLYLVQTQQSGVTIAGDEVLDLTRSIATVRFDGAEGHRLAGTADVVLDAVIDLANVALAAEQSGAIKSCIDITAAYANMRYSFGLPIGAYQGVKHKLADDYTEWSLVDASVRVASEALTSGASTASAAAAAARVLASPAYTRAAKNMMLLHGGIGFTWEHDAHLFYRNAVTGKVLLGGPLFQQDRLADKLGV
ncbi:alkylation response protein AidB-like acyl-CoA dehydrogenase [Antricoccus suffuscus]|uniref:Alkylation response protein AidB-like acyl-CoA dehydrogenase n=1 Tax=Antricoccus suffuscus TaxID=1629062 RepID=A0A2T0ZY69_9ACTN|nr:acyl-CoA dehydrogenase family protein [Antricoccus suffuscus]PRZ41234.1 alkylation response protein AidB-like acyl-CoA dehydrogenase [Antricoccus suffuscus]